jgi:primosomal protein N'
MATAAAAVGAAIRRVTSHLMSANAVSPESAIYFVPERRLQRRVIGRLMRRGVMVETKPDTYYLDIPAYDRWRRSMRGRAALAIGSVVLLSALAALLA